MQRVAPIVLLALAAANSHAQVRYRLVDLHEQAGSLGVQNTHARGLNDLGVVVGFEDLPMTNLERGIHWANDSATILEVLPKDTGTQGFAINNSNEIVGVSEEVIPNHPEEDFYEDQKATVWLPGVTWNLEDLALFDPIEDYDPRIATDVNESRQIVGWSRTLPIPHEPKGFITDGTTIFNLDDLTRPMAINNNFGVVGYSAELGTALFWANQDVTDLHNRPQILGATSRALDINDDSVIVGQAQFDVGGPSKPAMWTNDAAIDLLANLPEGEGAARAVSPSGQIVGSFRDLDKGGPERGFVAFNGGRFELLPRTVGADGWTELVPHDINALGQIVGDGVRDGESGRAFMLVPICASDIDGDGDADADDFFGYLDLFSAQSNAADIDGDSDIDAEDFFGYLDLFVQGC